jgi:hypothetical protein
MPLTAPQARKIACPMSIQKQATELTSPDGRLRRRTSQVKAWHLIYPRGSFDTFLDSPPAHEAHRLPGGPARSDPLRHSFVEILTHFGAGGSLRRDRSHSTKPLTRRTHNNKYWMVRSNLTAITWFCPCRFAASLAAFAALARLDSPCSASGAFCRSPHSALGRLVSPQ